MSDSALSSGVVRFDVFEVDVRAGELRKQGRRIKLQEQPLRVLSLLLERPGDLITREELRQNLWPADTFVDFDHGLNSAVARLRETLRDSADQPRFIETIAKRGYRFIAAIEQPPGLPAALAVTTPASSLLKPETSNTAWLNTWIRIGFIVSLCMAIGLWRFNPTKADPAPTSIEIVPLVGLRGFQVTPAFSPDGNLVAFRQTDGVHNTGIYSAMVGGDKSLQLTSDRGDCCPTWSPDGRQVAFMRYSDKTFSIYIVPALGGTEHRVYRGPASMGAGIGWSPDSTSLIFPESTVADTPRSWLSLLSLSDGAVRALTSPPPNAADREPSFSPDGSQIAFVRSTLAGVANDIYVMPVHGGPARRLTFDNRPIIGPPTWTPDGEEIVFSSDRGATTGLWRVPVKGGIPRPVPGPFGAAGWPSIPARGNTLVFEQVLAKFNIWRLNLKDPKHSQRAPSLLVSEKGDKMRPDPSPDGTKVAFESNRLGFWNIWVCHSDGSHCEQVTSLRGTAGRPRWSPDGRSIAFEYHPTERSEIYVVDIPGGVPRRLPTIPGADNLSPGWSRDGRWLYFASKSGREPFQIWKLPLQGGAAIRLTRNGGISPVESPDGRFLYYSKYEQGGLWRIPLQGGDEAKVLDEVSGSSWPDWGLTSKGIYFLSSRKSPATIQFFEFATQRTSTIWTLDKEPGWGLATSADGKSLVYVQNEFAESNIMLVKNFR